MSSAMEDAAKAFVNGMSLYAGWGNFDEPRRQEARQAAQAAITAYLSAALPADVEGLCRKLEAKAQQSTRYRKGQRWQDHVCWQAATALAALQARVDALEQDLADARQPRGYEALLTERSQLQARVGELEAAKKTDEQYRIDMDGPMEHLAFTLHGLERPGGTANDSVIVDEASARIESLTRERDAARAEAARYRDALAFYADPDSWDDEKSDLEIGNGPVSRIVSDQGDCARAALAQQEKHQKGKYDCPTCDGSGEIAPDAECSDCDGTGAVVPAIRRAAGIEEERDGGTASLRAN